MSSPSAGQRPNPWLVEWLRTFTATPNRKRCLVVGCGAGDDAEALASAGYTVTACDRSAEAIQTCRRRFPRSGVDYAVADILDPPPSWGEGFDLVFDASTLDTVAPALRGAATRALASVVGPAGRLLVICAEELAAFEAFGLRAGVIEVVSEDGTPLVRRVRAFFERPV
jgi:SAM-dependent methyltransferase